MVLYSAPVIRISLTIEFRLYSIKHPALIFIAWFVFNTFFNSSDAGII